MELKSNTTEEKYSNTSIYQCKNINNIHICVIILVDDMTSMTPHHTLTVFNVKSSK